jgi:hypothetical protein
LFSFVVEDEDVVTRDLGLVSVDDAEREVLRCEYQFDAGAGTVRAAERTGDKAREEGGDQWSLRALGAFGAGVGVLSLIA